MKTPLTLDILQNTHEVTYSTMGIDSGERLLPVRWDDGEKVWQVTRDGALVGFLARRTPARGNPGSVHRDRTYRQGTFEVVAATPTHLAILQDFADVAGTTRLVLDGTAYDSEVFGQLHDVRWVRCA
jgi:hypothetical protein